MGKNTLRRLIIVVSLLVLFVAILFAINSYRVDFDVDILSGNTRHASYVCGILIREEIEFTPFAKLVKEYVGLRKTQVWKNINSKKLLSKIWPYGGYHATAYLCQKLVRLFERWDIPDDEKRSILATCLSHMETGRIDLFEKEMDRCYKLALDEEKWMWKYN